MSIDPRVFRQTIGQFAIGVTIITTEIAGTVRALTVNSFTALSLDPPLVLFCVGKATKTGVVIHEAPGFAVNTPTFSFLEWDGGPRLEGCAAAVGCAIEDSDLFQRSLRQHRGNVRS